jgi:hypothetical protein
VTRDPRQDPHPGDVFRIASPIIAKDFAVVYTFPNGQIVVAVAETYPDQPTWAAEYCALVWEREQWTRRFRAATVVRVAGESP